VVTVLEVLSPGNKRGQRRTPRVSEQARGGLAKQRPPGRTRPIARGVRLPTVERLPKGDYYAFVCRGPPLERRRLSMDVARPIADDSHSLAAGDADAALDLQAAFTDDLRPPRRIRLFARLWSTRFLRSFLLRWSNGFARCSRPRRESSRAGTLMAGHRGYLTLSGCCYRTACVLAWVGSSLRSWECGRRRPHDRAVGVPDRSRCEESGSDDQPPM